METDPNGKVYPPGTKLDEGKPSLYRGVVRYFPRALERVAEVSDYGTNKHPWDGWRSVPDGVARYKDAAIRHTVKEEYEGLYDSETKLLHAAHRVWNDLVSLELLLDEMEGQRLYEASFSEEAEVYEESHGGDTLFWGIRTEGC